MQFVPYFKLNARPGIKGVVDDRGDVIFRNITVAQALELWKRGATYLQLTKEGARHYFGDTTSEERTELLRYCRTDDEVNALLDLPKPGKGFKAAAQARMATWAVPPASSGEAGNAQPKG